MGILKYWFGKNEITVTGVEVKKKFVFDPVDEGDVIELLEDARIIVKIKRSAKSIGKKNARATLDITFKKGFLTDGASVPEKLRREMPTYIAMDDEGAHIYNAAAFIHDGLYAYEGEVKEPNIESTRKNKDWHTLTRRECDDILKGVWDKSGFSNTVKTSIGRKGVRMVAGGPDHWGNDKELHCKPYFSASIIYD